MLCWPICEADGHCEAHARHQADLRRIQVSPQDSVVISSKKRPLGRRVICCLRTTSLCTSYLPTVNQVSGDSEALPQSSFQKS